MSNLPNIDDLVEPTHDEFARQRFTSVLRKRVLVDFAKDMKSVYENAVEPRFEKTNARKPKTGNEIRKEMLEEPIFQEWSALRHNAQLMSWWTVQPSVERKLPELIQTAKDVAAATPMGGSLRLDPNVDMPKTVTELDVHLMPGCFHEEHAADDVAQGAVLHHGIRVFYSGLNHRTKGGWAATAGRAVRIKFPDFKPKRMLDLGTSIGRELFSMMEVFPETEAHAIDVGAPMLRYAHARATALGHDIAFVQDNAEALSFPDKSFDLVVSHILIHETSRTGLTNILRESWRVLKPGGVAIHVDGAGFAGKDLLEKYLADWDTYFNAEPFVGALHDLDLKALTRKAGIPASAAIVETTADGYARHTGGALKVVGGRKPR